MESNDSKFILKNFGNPRKGKVGGPIENWFGYQAGIANPAQSQQ